MIPYPDVTTLPEDLATAVCRMVRLVNEMRRRRPELDRLALSTETELDYRAAQILVAWVERVDADFRLMVSPWDGRVLMDGQDPYDDPSEGEALRPPLTAGRPGGPSR